MVSNSSGVNIWFGDKDKVITGFIDIEMGTHAYTINKELLDAYPGTKYIVLADTLSAQNVTVDCTFEDIYNKIKQISDDIDATNDMVSFVETELNDVNSNLSFLKQQILIDTEQQTWNETNRGVWKNNALTCTPCLQKVPTEFEGHLVTGFKFYNESNIWDIVKVSLVTIDTEEPTAAFKRTDYAKVNFEIDVSVKKNASCGS